MNTLSYRAWMNPSTFVLRTRGSQGLASFAPQVSRRTQRETGVVQSQHSLCPKEEGSEGPQGKGGTRAGRAFLLSDPQ